MLKLIKEYIEGLKIYKCLKCNHIVHKPKYVPEEKFKCLYCGDKVEKKND